MGWPQAFKLGLGDMQAGHVRVEEFLAKGISEVVPAKLEIGLATGHIVDLGAAVEELLGRARLDLGLVGFGEGLVVLSLAFLHKHVQAALGAIVQLELRRSVGGIRVDAAPDQVPQPGAVRLGDLGAYTPDLVVVAGLVLKLVECPAVGVKLALVPVQLAVVCQRRHPVHGSPNAVDLDAGGTPVSVVECRRLGKSRK